MKSARRESGYPTLRLQEDIILLIGMMSWKSYILLTEKPILILKVKFIDNVDISGKININKGEIFEAREDGDFIMIRMKDDSTVKAPKSEIEGILEVVEGE